MVKKATDAVVEMIFEQQNRIEKNQKKIFDNLSSQLTELIAKYQPSTSNPRRPSQSSSEVQDSKSDFRATNVENHLDQKEH